MAVAIAVVVSRRWRRPSCRPRSVDGQRQKVEDIVDELERLEEQVEPARRGVRRGDRHEDPARRRDRRSRSPRRRQGSRARRSCAATSARWPCGRSSAEAPPRSARCSRIPPTSTTAVQRDELARVALSAGDVTTDELDALVSDLDEERADLAAKREQADELAESLVGRAGAHRAADRRVRSRPAPRPKQTLGELIEQEEAASGRGSAPPDRRRRPPSRQRSQREPARRRTQRRTATAAAAAAAAATPTRARGTTESGGGETPLPAAPAVSSRSGIAVAAAMSQLGVPYRYAASSPGVAFDCSGLTAYAWGAGRRRPAAPVARPVRVGAARRRRTEAQPGDLLFYLQPDQPRRHLPRRRPAGPRAEHRHDRQGRRGQLGQGRRRRPTRLTAPVRPRR